MQPIREVWHYISNNPLVSALVAGLLAAAIVGIFSGMFDGRESSNQPTTATAEVLDAPTPGPHREKAGEGGARTYVDPHTLAEPGPTVEPGQIITVKCKEHAPSMPSAGREGYWYLIVEPERYEGLFTPTNSYWNGDKPGRRPYIRHTDHHVPDC